MLNIRCGRFLTERAGNRRWFVAIAFLSLAGFGCEQAETAVAPTAPAAAEVEVAVPTSPGSLVRVTPITPTRKTLVRWLELDGQIEAIQETPLFAKLAGYVEKINVDIGDRVTGPQFDDQGRIVREGQLLMSLVVPELDEECRQKDAAVGQTQAEIVQAVAGVKVARTAEISARAKFEETEAALGQVQADYDFAAAESARLKKLGDRGSATREVAEEKEKRFRTAEAAQKQTLARIASARTTVAEKQALIEKAEADLATAKKRLVTAEADLQRVKVLQSYREVRAPYDGVVTARNVHAGQLVQLGLTGDTKPLLVVVQAQVMRLFVEVPEIDTPAISVGSEVPVRVAVAGSEVRAGKVTRTAWSLDAGRRTLHTEVQLANDDGSLRPGMSASVRLKVAERNDVLALPQSAVTVAEGESFCLTVDAESHIVRTKIETGLRAGDEIEIVAGLSGNAQVIGVNAADFREGQEVQVASAVSRL